MKTRFRRTILDYTKEPKIIKESKRTKFVFERCDQSSDKFKFLFRQYATISRPFKSNNVRNNVH